MLIIFVCPNFWEVSEFRATKCFNPRYFLSTNIKHQHNSRDATTIVILNHGAVVKVNSRRIVYIKMVDSSSGPVTAEGAHVDVSSRDSISP
jgi:hypothetical protein